MPQQYLSTDPKAGEPDRSTGGGGDERAFRNWYSGMSKQYDLDPDPDAPQQYYDYRAAYRAGAKPDQSGHWPSDYKKEGHPNLVVGGFHVQTGKRVPGTPRADEAKLVEMGWDPQTAKNLAATPEYLSEDPGAGEQYGALLGGPGATMGPARDDGQGLARVWEEAGRKLKEAFFGHPDRAEARAAGIGLQPTPAELGEAALAGGAAMLGGSAAGGIAAAPVRAGMAMVGGYAGEKAGRGLGEMAESAGAPRGTAAVVGGVGALAGAASPARALRSLAGGRAGAVIEAVNPRAGAALRQMMGGADDVAQAVPLASEGPRTLSVPPGMPRLPAQRAARPPATVSQFPAAEAGAARQAATVAPPAARPPAIPLAAGEDAAVKAMEVQARIVALRKNGLSGAQITSALRQLYKIKPSDGQRMVEAVFKLYKIGPKPLVRGEGV